MKTKRKATLALLMAIAMVVLSAVPAFAQTSSGSGGDPVEGQCTFNKYFVLDSTATVPAVEFTYTITPGTYQAATATTMEVLAGHTTTDTVVNLHTFYREATQQEIDDNDPNIVDADGTTHLDENDEPFAAGTKVIQTSISTSSSVTYPNISSAVFAPTDATYTSVQTGDTVTLNSDEKYAKKVVTVDFGTIIFRAPGIYRYVITENVVSGRTDLEYDTQKTGTAPERTRILDVYVIDDNGTVRVGSYVLRDAATNTTIPLTENNGSQHTGTKTYIFGTNEYNTLTAAETAATNAVAKDAVDDTKWTFTGNTGAPFDTQEEAVAAAKATIKEKVTLADKSDGFVNEFESQDLEFGKEVTGNQGAKDKYFEFKLEIEGASPNTTYAVDLTNADAEVDINAATQPDYWEKVNPATITTDENGDVMHKFYLHDGQYIKIHGLPVNTTYTITEVKEDYKQTEGITAAEGKGGVAYDDPLTGTIGSKTVKAYRLIEEPHTVITEDEWKALPTNEARAGYEAIQVPDPNQDVKTGFTNTRDGIIPTGVALAILPGVLLLAGGIIGATIVVKKKASRR